jgi:hypothetical protein
VVGLHGNVRPADIGQVANPLRPDGSEHVRIGRPKSDGSRGKGRRVSVVWTRWADAPGRRRRSAYPAVTTYGRGVCGGECPATGCGAVRGETTANRDTKTTPGGRQTRHGTADRTDPQRGVGAPPSPVRQALLNNASRTTGGSFRASPVEHDTRTGNPARDGGSAVARCQVCGERTQPGWTLGGRPACEVCWSRHYRSAGRPRHVVRRVPAGAKAGLRGGRSGQR